MLYELYIDVCDRRNDRKPLEPAGANLTRKFRSHISKQTNLPAGGCLSGIAVRRNVYVQFYVDQHMKMCNLIKIVNLKEWGKCLHSNVINAMFSIFNILQFSFALVRLIVLTTALPYHPYLHFCGYLFEYFSS